MDGIPLAGSMLDYALALPFAVALALYNQVFQRPSFHLAALFGAAPLFAAMLQDLMGAPLAVGFATAAGVALGLGMDRALAWAAPAREDPARAFFFSTILYLAAVQLMLMAFGAAPRSLAFGPSAPVSWGGLSVPIFVLGVHLVCLAIGGAVILFYDSRAGLRLRLAAGGRLEAALIGLKTGRLHLLAGLLAIGLTVLAALARGAVLPTSVYSGFPIFVLCFSAAALPPGTPLLLSAVLLLVIYLVRALAAFHLSAQAADAVTLAFALAMLTAVLSATSLRARGT